VSEAGALVSMRAIVKRFGAVEALRGAELELRAGEVLGLVGDNAAGKSTLMKILTGVHQPDEGHIVFNGHPVHFRNLHDSRALGIEMIDQDLALVPSLDVAANVFLGREKVRRHTTTACETIGRRRHASITAPVLGHDGQDWGWSDHRALATAGAPGASS
jgi:ABC-type sugar transport system ATPase subunit